MLSLTRKWRQPYLRTAWRLALTLAMTIAAAAGCGDDGTQPALPPAPDAAPSAPMAPYSVNMYIRGSFNGWGTDNPFEYVGDGRYEAYLRLPHGVHQFKIADADWNAALTLSLDGDISLGSPVTLFSAPEPDRDTRMIAPETGIYQFELVVESDSQQPRLTVRQDLAPYEQTLYLRGSFNDQGSPDNELPFVYQGRRQYQITIALAADLHTFKITDANLSAKTTFSAQDAIALDTPAALAQVSESDADTNLDISSAGNYTFEFTADAALSAPTLLVRKADPDAVVTINPHRDAIAKAEILGLPGSGHKAVLSIAAEADVRRYALSSTQPLRLVNLPNYVFIDEPQNGMTVRTGNLMFDGLFALALHEADLLSVAELSDGSFEPMACDCFETGEQWTFVWTRDISYSVELALALVDPGRAKRSLLFKLGDKRQVPTNPEVATGTEIVQDTGSGGSWPVSTDRVVWALGAMEVLKYLDGSEREEFLKSTYAAITNTIATDRAAVFDPRDGLYRGEQSFLDWRQQSYASWTAEDVVHIGMSKSLSTNVAHYAILSAAAQLAEETGDNTARDTYQLQANNLRDAINSAFWDNEAGMYRSLINTELDAAALDKYELLGQSLAILLGVADAVQTQLILAKYPHSVAGAPVIWPQQPDVFIYHNRAIWPFVSTYLLRAARRGENHAVVDHNLESLMRLAALNLSNMENFEFVTGSPSFFDPDQPQFFGPYLNSRRQLWSVAGYISAIVDVVFGREANQEGIRFAPFITRSMRNQLFADADEITLRGLPYRGKRIDVVIALPAADSASAGFYDLQSVTLNDQAVGLDQFITAAELADTNTIRIELGAARDDAADITVVTVADPYAVDNPAIFAPREPNLNAVEAKAGGVLLNFDANDESETRFRIYRDGELIAADLSGTSYQDNSADLSSNTHCYAVDQQFISSGNASHHSPPRCIAGAEIQDVEITAGNGLESLDGADTTTAAGTTYFADWGQPDQRLQVEDFTPQASGRYLLSLRYNNTLVNVLTGITASVKWVEVTDPAAGNSVVASGIVLMPQRPSTDFAESSYLSAELVAGRSYDITVSDFFNMSYLSFFTRYIHAGGKEGPVNRCDIAAMRIQAMSQ